MMITLRILRFFLPLFHPLKYRWIRYWWGEQSSKAWGDLNNKLKTKKI